MVDEQEDTCRRKTSCLEQSSENEVVSSTGYSIEPFGVVLVLENMEKYKPSGYTLRIR